MPMAHTSIAARLQPAPVVCGEKLSSFASHGAPSVDFRARKGVIHAREHRGSLGLMQQPLAQAVAVFIFALRGVGALMRFKIDFARVAVRNILLHERIEESDCRARLHAREPFEALLARDQL